MHRDGNFYGTTNDGGIDASALCLAPAIVQGETILPPNLYNLIQGNDGYLYGTTDGDGQFGGGTVFRMSVAGVKTVIHSFGGTN